MCEIGKCREQQGHVDLNQSPVINPSHDTKLEKEKKKKADLAAKRRERIMAQMARAQRNFIRENSELFNSTSSDSMDTGRSVC